MQKVISDLVKEQVFVFCVVADNAAAFQKAGRLLDISEPAESEIEDSDDEEISEVEDNEMLNESLQSLATEGLFCVRCAAHSLQLVCFVVSFSRHFLSHRFSKILKRTSLS